jgi:3-hydroxy acid dehydrogenase/malonic semialdehyde reductase
MEKIALVTGATSGIGKATAEILAANGCKLILTGRRKSRLIRLAECLSTDYQTEVLPLCFDVRKKEEVDQHLGKLPEEWKTISILVNNAGLAAGIDPIDEGNIDDWERMIDTNVKGLLYVSKAVIAIMKEKRSGHIINISSIAGKEVYPKGNVYCATKHAVDALSKAMRIDLLKWGIKVTNIAPGMAETEFSEVRFHGDKEAAQKVYKGIHPLSAEDIAQAIWFVVSRPNHVQIADMVIFPSQQASSMHVDRNGN